MLLRAILMLVLIGVPVTTAVTLGLRTVLAPMLEARRRRALGRRNQEEVCSLCLGATDPVTDHFDKKKNEWRHARCVRQLLSE